jgi:hypothetical protein
MRTLPGYSWRTGLGKLTKSWAFCCSSRCCIRGGRSLDHTNRLHGRAN